MDDKELQDWLDEGSEQLAKEASERKLRERLAPKTNWDEVKFNLKRDLYRKAINA